MPVIKSLNAVEILDSRGRPTVKVHCMLEGGVVGSASVPSGASSGAAEAHELRDNQPERYGGLGCRKAVAHVNKDIADLLVGQTISSQAELDQKMLDLDGTSNKSRLGANALLAVSIAFSRACALEKQVPLFTQFNEIAGGDPIHLPRPTINLFSGGLHAGGQVAIQDVLVVPASAKSIDEALAHTYAIFQAGASLAHDRYGYRLLRADEGGMAPDFSNADEMLSMAVEAIEKAGLRPGEDVFLAVDVASSHFFRQSAYYLGQDPISSEEMVEKGREQGIIVPGFVVSVAIRMLQASVKKQEGFHIRQISPIAHADKCFIPALFVAGEDSKRDLSLSWLPECSPRLGSRGPRRPRPAIGSRLLLQSDGCGRTGSSSRAEWQ